VACVDGGFAGLFFNTDWAIFDMWINIMQLGMGILGSSVFGIDLAACSVNCWLLVLLISTKRLKMKILEFFIFLNLHILLMYTLANFKMIHGDFA